MIPHPASLGLLQRRKNWFDLLTPERQKQFLDNREKYPDNEIIAVGFGGGCMRPEDSGHHRAMNALLNHADYILADSKGAIEASGLGNFDAARGLWEDLAGDKFIRLSAADSRKAAMANWFKVNGHKITKRSHSVPIVNRFVAAKDEIRAPIDMKYLEQMLVKYESENYRAMRPEVIVLASRINDGKLVGFNINKRSPEQMRQTVMASCRLVGVSGDPVTVDGNPEYVMSLDGRLERDPFMPPGLQTYADTVYAGHPALMAMALKCTQLIMYCNRTPEEPGHFDTKSTQGFLLGFVRKIAPELYANFDPMVDELHNTMRTLALRGRYQSNGHTLRASLIYHGGALTRALETDADMLNKAEEIGFKRGLNTMQVAEKMAARMRPLALPVQAPSTVPMITVPVQHQSVLDRILAHMPQRPFAFLAGLKARVWRPRAEAA